LVTPERALKGRDDAVTIPGRHLVLGTQMSPPFPEGLQTAAFGMGCFWGAERRFWRIEGIFTTAVGYAGGYTPNPTYKEVCTGRTGHAEVVLVVFDPTTVTYRSLVRSFFEGHDPTQGMRQGNDVGSQYRSAISTFDDEQQTEARLALGLYQRALSDAGRGTITTEVVTAGPFYYAEDYHQQYLAAHPNGYCGMAGTGVSCPVSA